jgi:hypothetical protein
LTDPLAKPLPGNLGKALAAALQRDEPVLAQLHTNIGEGLALTPTRAIVLKAGFIAGAGIFGKKAISFPYDAIAAVEHREGPLGGDVKIVRAGVPEAPPRGTPGDYADRNRAKNNHITYQRRSLRGAMRTLVRMIDQRRRRPADLIEAISQLEALRDRGSLTQDEFTLAKRRLLEA